MLYAAIFHSLAGVVTGSVFQVRTLLLLLVILLIEAAALAAVDIRFAGYWALANLSLLQIGYFVAFSCAGSSNMRDFRFRPLKFIGRRLGAFGSANGPSCIPTRKCSDLIQRVSKLLSA